MLRKSVIFYLLDKAKSRMGKRTSTTWPLRSKKLSLQIRLLHGGCKKAPLIQAKYLFSIINAFSSHPRKLEKISFSKLDDPYNSQIFKSVKRYIEEGEEELKRIENYKRSINLISEKIFSGNSKLIAEGKDEFRRLQKAFPSPATEDNVPDFFKDAGVDDLDIPPILEPFFKKPEVAKTKTSYPSGATRQCLKCDKVFKSPLDNRVCPKCREINNRNDV